MSGAVRRKWKISVRLDQDQRQTMDDLMRYWNTQQTTYLVEKMLEFCRWELLTKPEQALKEIQPPRKKGRAARKGVKNEKSK